MVELRTKAQRYVLTSVGLFLAMPLSLRRVLHKYTWMSLELLILFLDNCYCMFV